MSTETDTEPPVEGGSLQAQGGEVEQSLRRLDRLATLLDDQFRLPIVDYRVGIDPLLGLLPGGGDWVTWVAGAYVIWGGASLGAPPRLLAIMAGNTVVDLVGGYVPILGDLFDATYKSNRRNVDLLYAYFEVDEDDPSAPDAAAPRPSLIKHYALAAGLIVVLAALAALPLVFVWWMFQ